MSVPTGAWQQLLYWVPAMGMPAKHYLSLADALAARGIAVVLHEWRGIGSSTQRAGRHANWGYRELLQNDLVAGMSAVSKRWPKATCWMGGHSLGGQLSVLYASLHPQQVSGLLLVASGAPYWKRYRHGWLIGLALLAAPLLAGALGYLPGRRLGFAGNEARGVVADWARSGCSGRYTASGMNEDLERTLAELRLPLLALRLRDDWLGPAASLNWLLDKLGSTSRTHILLTPLDMKGQPADHFSWMKAPGPVAARIADWIAKQNAASGSHEHPPA
ncbi:MAG: alpha/beta fold hydrolase [Rhodanobacter sp.]